MNHRWNAPRLTAVALLFCAATAPIHAQAVDAPIDWQQPAQPLGGALTALAVRTGLIVGVDAAAVRGKQAPALQGRYTPHEALQPAAREQPLQRLSLGPGASATMRQVTIAGLEMKRRGHHQRPAKAHARKVLEVVVLPEKAFVVGRREMQHPGAGCDIRALRNHPANM